MPDKSSKKKPRKSSRGGNTTRNFFLLGVALLFTAFGLLSFFGKNGILEMIQLQAMEKSLQTENSVLVDQQEELRAEIDRLNQPRYIEYLARERFGLMRSNEAFLIVDPPSPHSPVDN